MPGRFRRLSVSVMEESQQTTVMRDRVNDVWVERAINGQQALLSSACQSALDFCGREILIS